MKLKKILNEITWTEEKREAVDLYDKLVRDDYRVRYPTFIYRAEKDKIEYWKEKSIRKDRNPRDTLEWVDSMVRGIEDGHYPNYPKRRSSKFASSSTEGLDEYGKIYYMFIKNDSLTGSLPYDAYLHYFDEAVYTRNIPRYRPEFMGDLDNDPSYIELKELFDIILGIYKSESNLNDLYTFVKKYWDAILDQSITLQSDSDYDDFMDDGIIKTGLEWFEMLNLYFHEMQINDIQDDDKEILIQADNYITADRKFISENFRFQQNQIKLDI